MQLIDYNKEEFKEYKHNLQLIGSISQLFSNSEIPYLDYRVPENLYCECLKAKNISRSCVAADAKFDNIGIGIKTFIDDKDTRRTYQKIAEFNKARASYNNLDGLEKIKKIAELRNERIQSTMSQHGLSRMIYHCVIRTKNGFHFHEEEMERINIDKIALLIEDNSSITFKDDKHEYSFNLSKSTLLKKFEIDEYFDNIEIKIAKNPLDVLQSGINSIVTSVEKEMAIIPLYSFDKYGNKMVYEHSGLNQWNAGGRERTLDEVYIPYNKEIRDKFEGFFPNRDTAFNVRLPNGKIMSMKLCQNNKELPPKAIMSNPNSQLGEWILREVLRLENSEVLTYKKLAEIGIESVVFEKDDSNNYTIDFVKINDDSDEENSQE